jgi:CDP-paratose 2-epimerase
MKHAQYGASSNHNQHPVPKKSATSSDALSKVEQSSAPQANPAITTPAFRAQEYVLIVGGAGFIGSNLAHRLMEQGKRVLIFDSLARPGVERNLRWLHEQHGDHLSIQIADVRNRRELDQAVRHANSVYHLGAQVAVTTSIANPIHDFEVNAQGTLFLLEALRSQGKKVPLLFTSTNKVYGDLLDVGLSQDATRYYPDEPSIRQHGISEARPLAFHSPYGCSKGAADQYVLDYAHTYGMPSTVFRMSCIYGPRQFGTEDQGWVAHFLIRALQGQPITIYGDGKQVRDILFVDDLVNALQLAHTHIDRMAGQAFNVGGGPNNAISLLELLRLIEQLQGAPVVHSFDEWRRGDQRYYVSNTRKLEQTVGWRTQVSVQDGLARLYSWLLTIHSPVNSQVGARVGSSAVTAPLQPALESHRERITKEVTVKDLPVGEVPLGEDRLYGN